MRIIVPPIKCQGIKTKLVPTIRQCVPPLPEGMWIEPFCGSCVVAINLRPAKALLADTNEHIIALYRAIQSGDVTAGSVKRHLESESKYLLSGGADYYYEVRTRFNEGKDPLDFLFLNRSCFNGVMRFNKSGAFNVPFCHKPGRFQQAYITKIVNQVKSFGEAVRTRQWQFEVLDFRETLSRAKDGDFVYADPPYAGRHVDYFNHWTEEDQGGLVDLLSQLQCKFILSTWYENKYRRNPHIDMFEKELHFSVRTQEHFYHVGPTEELRNSMTEALVANYDLPEIVTRPRVTATTMRLFA